MVVLCCVVVQEMPLVQHVLKAGLAQDTDLYFMAQVERGTGERRLTPHLQYTTKYILFFHLHVSSGFFQPHIGFIVVNVMLHLVYSYNKVIGNMVTRL